MYNLAHKAVSSLCCFLLAVSPALAVDPGQPIGTAVNVVNKVTAEFNKDERTLITNDDVRHSDVIEVAPDGLSEIVLADETKLALGPGARLTLDRFVYDPDKTGGAIVLNMARGAFRFITGLAKKPSYIIRTPTASITVRGTIFDVYVEESGAIWMLLHEGAVQVCNDRSQCQKLDNPCRAVRVDGGGDVGDPSNWNGLHRDDDIDFATAFPFVDNPPGVDPEPRFQRASIEKGSCGSDEIKPRKTRRVEPRDPPSRPKVQKAKAAPKVYKPKPKKAKVVPKRPAKKQKYTKKNKDNSKDAAKAAAAIGLAIGIGIAIGKSKGKKDGGHNGGRKGNKY